MHEYEFERGNDVHTRICDRLKKSEDLTERSLGKRLEKLRQLRNLADYDWNKKDNDFFCRNLDYIKAESQKGMEQLEALKSSPPYGL